MKEDNVSYVYVLMNPTVPGPFKYGRFVFRYQPFYVGKGKGARAYVHLDAKGSTHKDRKIRKLQREGTPPIVKIKKHGLSDRQARELECKLIEMIGRDDAGEGPLLNLTDGGEGANQALSSRKLRASSVREHWMSMTPEERDARRERISLAIRARSPERIEEISRKQRATKRERRESLTDSQLRAESRAHSARLREAFARRSPEEKRSFQEACRSGQDARYLRQLLKDLPAACATLRITLLEPVTGYGKILHRCLDCTHEWRRLIATTANMRHGCPKCSQTGGPGAVPGSKWFHDADRNYRLMPDDPRIRKLRLVPGRV